MDADNARAAIDWAVQADQPEVALTIANSWLQAIPFSLYRECRGLADTCDALNRPAVPVTLRQRVALVLGPHLDQQPQAPWHRRRRAGLGAGPCAGRRVA